MNEHGDIGIHHEYGKARSAYHKLLHVFTFAMYLIGLVWVVCKIWKWVLGA